VYTELLPARINGDLAIDALSTFVGRRSELDELLIRLFDIVGSLIVLLVSFPVLIFIALAVRVSSRGQVIYKQQRVGKDGKAFTLYKYRSMYVHDHKRLQFTPAGKRDPRVTFVGRFLRRFHLDELPQLINVLRGDMSLVGPRPENLYRLERHASLRGLRLSVRPGITGLAQIRSAYDLSPERKIRYDSLYIQKRSLLLNLYVLLQTVPAVLARKGW
jgi:lipopolysaccharide/colanic/teichoic acid biosynthesis glycosyltransferase